MSVDCCVGEEKKLFWMFQRAVVRVFCYTSFFRLPQGAVRNCSMLAHLLLVYGLQSEACESDPFRSRQCADIHMEQDL